MPECSLGHDWRFAEIEARARCRSAFRYKGRRLSSPAEPIVRVAHQLEEELLEEHRGLSPGALVDFWSSYELHRYIWETGVFT